MNKWFKIEHFVDLHSSESHWIHSLNGGHLSRFDFLQQAIDALDQDCYDHSETRYRVVEVSERIVHQV